MSDQVILNKLPQWYWQRYEESTTCAHNPERIFQIWERAMWIFQPTIDLDSLRAILLVE